MKRIAYLLMLFPLLVGCKEKENYSYYMQHPSALKQAIMSCQNNYSKTNAEAAQCEIVFSAANDMLTLINEQQAHPEAFGQRILDDQINYVKLKNSVKEAKGSLEQLKQKSASSAEIRMAQDDLYKAKKSCIEQLEEIKILLAVIGMGSPE